MTNIEKYASDLEVYLVLFDKEAFEIAKDVFPEYLKPISGKEKGNIELFCRYYGYDRFELKSDWNKYKVYHIWKKCQEGKCIGYPKFALELNGEFRLASLEETLQIMGIKK